MSKSKKGEKVKDEGEGVKVTDEETKTEIKDVDPGATLIVSSGTAGYALPLIGQLPDPDDRLYHNLNSKKPIRKLNELKVHFGKLTK